MDEDRYYEVSLYRENQDPKDSGDCCSCSNDWTKVLVRADNDVWAEKRALEHMGSDWAVNAVYRTDEYGAILL